MSDQLLATLLALENQVWQALQSGDRDADSSLLCDTFLGVYPSGFANREDHSGQLSQGPSVLTYSIADAIARVLSSDIALLTYRASFTRPDAPADQRVMYVSSIWQRQNGQWLNIFSQDTDAA